MTERVSSDRIPIREGNGRSQVTDDPLTMRDLQVESRLTKLETIVEEIRSVVTQARPQLALMSMLGSAAGAVIVGIVIWLITGK